MNRQETQTNFPDSRSVDPQLVKATATPLPPKDSFVMSFIRPKQDLVKFLSLVLTLFLVVSLPLAVVSIRQRQLDESQGQVVPLSCVCEGVTADRELENLNVGDVIVFTGMAKTNELNNDIRVIKFIIKRNGEDMIVEERKATFDHQEGDLRFYKSDEFSYVIQEDGDYEVNIQVDCPDG